MQNKFVIIKELSIPSTFDYISKIEELVESICLEFDIENGFGNVLIAVTEAINNAIIHGNKRNIDKKINIQVAEKDDLFYFSIEDEGRGFDYFNYPNEFFINDINQEYGRGIFLIKELSDTIEFMNNGSRIIIYFSKSNLKSEELMIDNYVSRET